MTSKDQHTVYDERDPDAMEIDETVEEVQQDIKKIKYFRLLDLPSELRNAIYSYVLEDHTQAQLFEAHDLSTFALPVTTRINKQIRRETLALFFASSPFRVYIGSNFRDRFIRRTNNQVWSPATAYTLSKCGVLGMNQKVKKIVREAGPQALFTDIKFDIVSRQNPGMYDDTVVELRLQVKKNALSWTVADGWLAPNAGYYHLAGLHKEDVDTALHEATEAAKDVAKADEVFKGFALKDLELIVKVFRFKMD